MNILFARYNFAESDTHAIRELRGLVAEATKRGHDVTLLTGARTDKSALPENLQLQVVNGTRRAFEALFQELLKSGKYDRNLTLEAMPGAQFCIPEMTQGFTESPELRPNLFDVKSRKEWKRAQEVLRVPSLTGVFCSGEVQKLVMRVGYGVPSNRIINVSPVLDDMHHGGPDAEEVALLRKSHACEAPEALLIVTFAEDWEDAGVDRALTALARMPKMWRDRIQFLVVGGNHEDGLERLQKQATALEFPINQVQYLPDYRQPRLLFYGANLLLLPARQDHSGDLLADALTCGLPVLCTASCGLSPFVQATGCSVINNPFDEEILEEVLAFSLPKLELIRLMLTNRVTMHLGNTRSAEILNHLEEGPMMTVPQLSDDEAQRLLEDHLAQVANQCAMKMDRKRNISRVRCQDGITRIVKEYKRIHFWDGERHIKRAIKSTELMRFFTPQCQKSIHRGNSDFLIFGDCGQGNFFTKEYLYLPNIKQLYTACGTLLAHVHTAGIYHLDCKPANFVRNTSSSAECTYPICLIDCDNVQKYPLPLPWNKRIHNLAQFVSGTGNLARQDMQTWMKLIRAFQDGYARNSFISQDEMIEFWNQFWDFMAKAKHIEYTLPFSCAGDDLQKLRHSLH